MGADDEARTRDLNLGKVALYQLSYVRSAPEGARASWRAAEWAVKSGASYSGGMDEHQKTPIEPLRKPALSTDSMVMLGVVGVLFLAFIVGAIRW